MNTRHTEGYFLLKMLLCEKTTERYIENRGKILFHHSFHMGQIIKSAMMSDFCFGKAALLHELGGFFNSVSIEVFNRRTVAHALKTAEKGGPRQKCRFAQGINGDLFAVVSVDIFQGLQNLCFMF